MSEHRHRFVIEGRIVYFIHSHAPRSWSGDMHNHDVDAQRAYPAQMPRPKRLRVVKEKRA